MNELIIVLLAMIVLAFIAARVAYYAKKHKAIVVGILKTGVLVYLSEYSETVFVKNSAKHMKPVEGDVIWVKHPLFINLKRRRMKCKSFLPDEYVMLRGYEKTSNADNLRESIGSAILISEVSTARWLAKQGDRDILIELDGEDHKIGDEITYMPASISLKRFYYV